MPGWKELMMDVRVLRYFLAIAREESFTGAAEALMMSQPTLSKQIAQLEHELGKKLFERGGRRVALTEDGMLLYRRAEEIVTLVDRTEREFKSDEHDVSGEVAVGGHIPRFLLKAAARTHEAHRGIRFYWHNGDATDVSERLQHGTLDFAVLLQPVDVVRYDFVSLPDVARWGALVPVGGEFAGRNVLTADDLKRVPLAIHHREGLQREFSLWAGSDTDEFDVSATYNVLNGSPTPFVTSGLGCVVTTDDHLDGDESADVRFLPLDPPLETRCALVYRRHAALSKSAAIFLEQVNRSLQSMHEGNGKE